MKSTRNKALVTLGLSEDDIKTSVTLFQQLPLPPIIPRNWGRPKSPDPAKAEKLMGYATLCLQREKALKVLGTSEEDVEVENSKSLGALGQSGRRRSYLFKLPDPEESHKHSFCSSADCLHKRRRRSLDKHIPYSSRKKRRVRCLIRSTGQLTRSKRSPSGLSESNKPLYIEEMNRLKAALFHTQVEMSNLQNRIQQMEEKKQENWNYKLRKFF